ncbi:hypothetical protein ACIHAX_15215 [Nocardia sp. NPDC051929]|uniref:hypothetical protein n=1 Tax=Nocardia sp. NPDC051929 TaxID=3364327 RepID=UPI0037CC4AE7
MALVNRVGTADSLTWDMTERVRQFEPKATCSTFSFARSGILCPLRQADTVEFTEWNFRSAEECAAALRAGDVTSAELTDEAIAHIERDGKVAAGVLS